MLKILESIDGSLRMIFWTLGLIAGMLFGTLWFVIDLVMGGR